jgi:hypothetical protein
MDHYFYVQSINVLHINHSLFQRGKVDVYNIVVLLNVLQVNCSIHQLTQREKRLREKTLNVFMHKKGFS